MQNIDVQEKCSRATIQNTTGSMLIENPFSSFDLEQDQDNNGCQLTCRYCYSFAFFISKAFAHQSIVTIATQDFNSIVPLLLLPMRSLSPQGPLRALSPTAFTRQQSSLERLARKPPNRSTILEDKLRGFSG